MADRGSRLTIVLVVLSVILFLLWVYLQKEETSEEARKHSDIVGARRHRTHRHTHKPLKRHPRREPARGSVGGRVFKPDGSPCGGAEVEVICVGHNWSVVTRTDSDGNFFVDNVPPGKLLIIADLKGHPRAHSESLWLVPAGSLSNIRLTLRDAITLIGRVVAEDTKKPIEGAKVAIRRVYSSIPDAEVVTDAFGNFIVRGLKRDEYYINVSADGYIQKEKIPDSWVLKDSVSEVSIFMEPAARITGRVKDESGRPVSGATVSFNRTSVRTNEDGSYILNVRADTADLIVVHKDYAMEVVELLEVVEGDWRVINITLKKGCLLKGRIKGADDGGIPKARIRLIRYWRNFSALYVCGEVSTDEEGRYEFLNVASGTHYLEVRAEGYGLKYRMIEIPAGMGECVQNFVLQEGGVIAGYVVDTSGRGIGGVEVELFGGPAPISATVRTEEDGSFIVKDMPNATYTLRFSKDGYVPVKEENVLPETTKIKVTLLACGSVEGVVSFESTPQANVAVTVWERPDLKFRTYTNTEGYYKITDLKPGTYTLLVESRGFLSSKHRIYVREGTTTNLDVTLQKE